MKIPRRFLSGDFGKPARPSIVDVRRTELPVPVDDIAPVQTVRRGEIYREVEPRSVYVLTARVIVVQVVNLAAIDADPGTLVPGFHHQQIRPVPVSLGIVGKVVLLLTTTAHLEIIRQVDRDGELGIVPEPADHLLVARHDGCHGIAVLTGHDDVRGGCLGDDPAASDVIGTACRQDRANHEHEENLEPLHCHPS